MTGSPYGGKSPGIVIRKASTSNSFEIKSTYTTTPLDGTRTVVKTGTNAFAGTDVRVFRINGVIYTSIDNGPLMELQDMTNPAFSQQFGLSAWFGAYPDNVNCTENCTQAKRYFEGELSNMYIKLGDFDETNLHEVTFDGNSGTPTTTYLILDGNSITEFPTATRTDWTFGGWWTAASGGTQVTAPITPSTDLPFYAHWYKAVSQAEIENDDIDLAIGGTETISITNQSLLEPYTLVSANGDVATVDQSTGLVTAVGAGTTTITMTGSITGDTKTITVTVGTVITVYFDPDYGTESVVTRNVSDGGTMSDSTIPQLIRNGYALEGWYTGHNGTGTKLTTSTVFGGGAPTYYYANWTEMIYVCKIATSLHYETCSQASGKGCRKAGWSSSARIDYGHLVSKVDETHGAAYDCDVDYDGVFDAETERFYYFGTENGNAKLVYYKNMENNASVAYSTAVSYLPNYELDQQNPSIPVWDNPYLVTYDSGTYTGKAARFMTYPEISNGLWSGNTNNITPNNNVSTYLFEQSNFANTNKTDGIWLEEQTADNFVNRIQTMSLTLTHGAPGSTSANASRPTIEVPVEYMETYYVPPETYEITFEPHNETSSFTVEVVAGQALGSNYPSPDPTYTNHLFQGWYTGISGGTLITNQTVPTGDNTYHAQWLKTVALAELASNSINVEAGDSATINVTNSAELEPYSFSSNNTSIATVNSTTGEVTGVANGSTTITMTGTTSGATKTINVVVADLLPVTQAIIANNDLTVTEGEQITIVVSNSALLEPYTFSSEDSSIATVNSTTGVIAGVNAGTTRIIMTGANTGSTKMLEVEVLPAPAVQYQVTFNANGGTLDDGASSTRYVNDGDAVGTLPTASKTDYKFFGWYTDNGTFYNEVYPVETVTADVTYYARWVEDTASFPIVWSEINACTFNGTSNMTGDYCTQNKSRTYVDTGIALYNATNYDYDYEIGFTIVSFTPSVSQETIFNEKYEATLPAGNYPGIMMRSSGTTKIEMAQTISGTKGSAQNANVGSLHTVKIVRQSGVVKYSYDGAALRNLQDMNALTEQTFDSTTWFGASATASNTPQRQSHSTLTDMYIRLAGTPTHYNIRFSVNGGTFTDPNETGTRSVAVDSSLGTLPTVTPPNSNYTFDGWYDESVSPAVAVSASTVPTANKTYVAHYTYQSSDTPVTFDVSNDATRGYKSIINQWVQSPVNITTFNETSPINNSTWGDTNELSEANFWSTLRTNFQTYNCMIPSYGDARLVSPNSTAWANGSVDCSKPDEYNTSIGEPLNVYLYNNQTLGAQVAYAEADDGIIRNLIPGNTYKWVKDGDSTIYGYVTVTSDGSDHGTRWVDAGVIRNVRDIGGLPADTDGDGTVDAYVDYGRIFRGEKLWTAPATNLTNLGITKEYDVGNPSEYSGNTKLPNYKNDQVIHYNFDYNSGDENNPTSNYMKAWTAVTDIMTDVTNSNNPQNVYIHCRVGADRTGTVAYLLEGLLGVPDEERYQEYSLTHLSGLFDRTRYYKMKASDNAEKFVFMMDYLQTTSDIITWYMHHPNADQDLIDDFRAAMTTPISLSSPANNNENLSLLSLNSGKSASINSGGSGSVIDAHTSYNDPLGESEEDVRIIPSSDAELAIAIVTTAALVTVSSIALSSALDKRQKKEEGG